MGFFTPALGALAATPAEVELLVISEPAGADVSVESLERPGFQRSGRAEPEVRLRLPPGAYRVQLRLRRYRPVTEVLALSQARRLRVVMEEAAARLEVATPGSDDTARGGELRIDDRMAGVVPVPVEVTAGKHVIEVRKPGYRSYRQPIELEAGESRTLWVALQAEVRTGSLLVGGSGQVWVDKKARGAAPLLLDNLPEGEHQVEMRDAAGAALWQRVVRVVAGQQQRVAPPAH